MPPTVVKPCGNEFKTCSLQTFAQQPILEKKPELLLLACGCSHSLGLRVSLVSQASFALSPVTAPY
eukprot:319390-Hanusia_phi.AAC.1